LHRTANEITNNKTQIPNKSQNTMNQIPNVFESLEIGIWILPFDLAQGGELVEPFVICYLVLGIFSIRGLDCTNKCHTSFLILVGQHNKYGGI
jgi:hypothetical protein